MQSQLPFREIPLGPRPALTFVSPGALQDYFVPNSEVSVSQYPLIADESASWPEEDEGEGGEIPVLAAGGDGPRPQVADDVEFVDPDERGD